MRLFARAEIRCFARVSVAVGIVTMLTIVALRGPAAAAGGLAYDELNRMVMGSQGSGPPEAGSYANGSFAADFQAAVNSGAPAKAHHGMFSAITNAMAQGEAAMNMLKNGTPSTHYFLNGWERTDDPVSQTATIRRADLGQIIHLNLANKTYYIESMNAQSPPEETPPPMSSRPMGPQPSPQPGTAKMTISASTAGLGPKTLDGQSTNGYKMSFKMSVTQATGSCSNGSFSTSMTEFISQYPEPTVATAGGKTVTKKPTYDPQRMSVKPGCKPTITANTKIGPTPPSGMLPLWMYMDMGASMNAQQAQAQAGQGAGGSFGFMVERGNVRTLGASDSSLFQVPAGFTQTSAPGSGT